MHHTNIEIANLIEGCKQYERKTQKAMYKHFYSYAMSICIRYSDSREDAVEIMNDGFLKVLKYIKGFDLDRPFKPWLRKILINSSIDHLNSKNKLIIAQELDSALDISPEEQKLDSVSYSDLLEMIRKLPPSYGAVFNLRAIEGYKHEEISKMLGVSVGTSKSNYSKARAILQKYLVVYFGV